MCFTYSFQLRSVETLYSQEHWNVIQIRFPFMRVCKERWHYHKLLRCKLNHVKYFTCLWWIRYGASYQRLVNLIQRNHSEIDEYNCALLMLHERSCLRIDSTDIWHANVSINIPPRTVWCKNLNWNTITLINEACTKTKPMRSNKCFSKFLMLWKYKL